jgi:LysR family transcriptional regulator for bpeEF and oprC
MDVMQSMGVFRRVAEANSFSAVARETSMSQSTVSKHIASLEERLGTKLLNRSTRSLSLTEAGTEYYHYCVRILNDFQEAEASVGKGRIKPTGTLRFTSTSPFGKKFIIPILGDFLEEYPDIEIDYIMEDRFIDLVKEGVDVAIRVGPLADSSLVARKIGTSRRVVVASPEYLIKHSFPKTPADLKSRECLLYSLPKPQNEWFFSSPQFGDESVIIKGRFKASSNDAICEAALAGLGIATMCEWHVRDHVKKGRLTVLLKNYQLTPFDINAVYPERRYVPEKVKRLIDHLKEDFKKYE